MRHRRAMRPVDHLPETQGDRTPDTDRCPPPFDHLHRLRGLLSAGMAHLAALGPNHRANAPDFDLRTTRRHRALLDDAHIVALTGVAGDLHALLAAFHFARLADADQQTAQGPVDGRQGLPDLLQIAP